MQARLRIKVGNPIIRSEESEIDKTLYNYLRSFVDSFEGVDCVRLEPTRLVIEGYGLVVPYRYPHVPTMEWVFTSIQGFDDDAARKVAYSKIPKRIKEFIELCKKEVKKGASLNITDGVVTLQRGTFTARWEGNRCYGCFDTLPEYVKRELMELQNENNTNG